MKSDEPNPPPLASGQPDAASELKSPEPALPQGKSEWDRLPAEIHDMIIERAGLLTRWATGRIKTADFRRLGPRIRKQLWAEVVECGWEGDPGQLPPCPPVGPELFWPLRSRALHARLKALGNADIDQGLAHAAARNLWHDLLPTSYPQAMAELAASAGSLELLQHLVLRKRIRVFTPSLPARAAAFGHINVLEWLHAQMPRGAWTAAVADSAAAGGHLPALQWLMARIPEGCTPRALDLAAKGGHVAVMEWLRDNTDQAFSSKSYDFAAGAGQLHALQWLRDNTSAPCCESALFKACRGGHADCVAWILENVTGVHGQLNAAYRLSANQACRTVIVDYIKAHDLQVPLTYWANANDSDSQDGFDW
ncbi:hypothetical protein HK105_202202 [Polyrhizophydium stewartii]|uniref:Ankyrin repeat protein n=1 Tax=Polyrhizophydium stewartii TaxID=2732419 RepID=A0ABR4NFH5_9FUNG